MILGLDISTSCIGICLLDDVSIILLDYIDLSKNKTFWLKSDAFRNKLSNIQHQFGKINTLAIEEPLLGFQKGMSSAATITTLMKFNGMASLIARDLYNVEPVYISAASARKLCGIKLYKTSVAGMTHKEQVFNYMREHDLSQIQWKFKKTGKPVDSSKDMCDAYVIAKAAILLVK